MGFGLDLGELEWRNPYLELSQRGSSPIWRTGGSGGIHTWSSAGGIAVLFGAQEGVEESILGARPARQQQYLAHRREWRNPYLERGWRDSSTGWRTEASAGIHTWSSPGGIAVLFGAVLGGSWEISCQLLHEFWRDYDMFAKCLKNDPCLLLLATCCCLPLLAAC